jgi:hypothetical protein
VPQPNWLQFPGYAVTFNLVSIGPGSGNLVCENDFDTGDCSINPISPFILNADPDTSGSGTTRVSLPLTVLVTDATGSSLWTGALSTNFAGVTPAQIQNFFAGGPDIAGYCTGGACTSSYAGTIRLTSVIPEPSSIMTMGAGLIAVAIGLRRRQKKA